MLYGSPGTGKTSLVRALAEHLDIPVVVFNLATFTNQEFQNKWSDLRGYVPCIALIEDIDNVFEGRKSLVNGAGYSKPVSFDTLLNTLDGIENSDGVFTILTTNRIECLDEALGRPTGTEGSSTRPGRIDRVIKLDILDEVCRRKIATRILSDYPEFIDTTVVAGTGESGAQFQDRCAKLALTEYWDRM